VHPAVGIEVAKREHHEPGTLSADELERLVDAVPDCYRAFVLVAAYSSLRWSALVALRVDRLDLPRNRIRVEKRITESGRLIYGAPKTARSRRAVTIPHTITLELAEHLRRYPRGRADSSSPRSTAASFVGRRSPGSSGTPQRSRLDPRVPGSASCGTPARHSHSRLARTQSSSRFGWAAPPRGCSSSGRGTQDCFDPRSGPTRLGNGDGEREERLDGLRHQRPPCGRGPKLSGVAWTAPGSRPFPGFSHRSQRPRIVATRPASEPASLVVGITLLRAHAREGMTRSPRGSFAATIPAWPG
jgi:hypothetical protein